MNYVSYFKYFITFITFIILNFACKIDCAGFMNAFLYFKYFKVTNLLN
jgi:hypothetical protein